MKLILTILFIVAAIGKSWAQQDPIYAQYMLNPVLLNPGYTGINNNLMATAGYRVQWTGFEGQPRTFNASVHSSILDNKLGAGLIVMQDKAGNVAITEAALTAAYKLELKHQDISFGMQAGMQNFSSDNTELNIHDPGDLAFEGAEQSTKLNLGVGVVVKSERYYAGLSVPRLLPSTLSNDGKKIELYQQHYYFAGAYKITLNDNIDLQPTILLRATKGAPLSTDIGMNLHLNRAYSVGLFTRNTKTYGILLQALLTDTYRIGYGFELPTSKTVGSPYNTHEISIGIITSAFTFHERAVPTF